MTDPTHANILQRNTLSDETPNMPTRPATAHIVALSSDLMLTVRLEAIARAMDCSIETVPAFSALPPALTRERVDLVILDLADAAFSVETTCPAIRERSSQAKVLAFYPHVRTELGQAATAAGCDVVMPRSRLLANPGEALRDILPERLRRESAGLESGGEA
jgi:DNA-binding NarL/FixJ family response regulator